MLGGLVPRRLCARPTRFLSLALFVISLFWILSNRSLGEIRALERPAVVQSPAWHAGAGGDPAIPKANGLPGAAQAPLRPAGDGQAGAAVEPPKPAATTTSAADIEAERKKAQEQDEERARQERERKEHEMRVQFEAEYAALES